jgi:tetraacyldisaccharide-1-P 4'-kinase
MANVISTAEAIALIESTKGKMFSVVFVKRTTGEHRKMVARLGVQKHLAGGDAAYSFAKKGLISVYDVQKKGYRAIPTESISTLVMGGNTYTIA